MLALPLQSEQHPGPFLLVASGQVAAYLAAVWAVWNGGSSRRLVIGIAAVALIMRVPVVLAPPRLSSDVYRYVWDGRVAAAGINPYRYVPADPHLQPLRDTAIFPHINRAGTAVTIYPPVAQGIFLAVTRFGQSVTVIKAAMVGFEALTFALLLVLLAGSGLPLGRVAVYAWHPLPLWEFAGSSHIDAALIALVAAALCAARYRREVLAGVLIAAAVLTKLYPAVLLPALYRRWNWRMPAAFAAAVVIAYLPFVGVGRQVLGFLPGYAGEEGFDAGGAGFYLLAVLRHVPGLGGLSGRAYLLAALAVMAGLGVAAALGRRSTPPRLGDATVLAAAFTVLLSPHYAWYFAWLIVFACVVRSFALLWLTNACLLLYLVPIGSHIVRDHHRLLIETLIYAPFAGLAVADLWYHRRHHRPGTRSP